MNESRGVFTNEAAEGPCEVSRAFNGANKCFIHVTESVSSELRLPGIKGERDGQ